MDDFMDVRELEYIALQKISDALYIELGSRAWTELEYGNATDGGGFYDDIVELQK